MKQKRVTVWSAVYLAWFYSVMWRDVMWSRDCVGVFVNLLAFVFVFYVVLIFFCLGS